MSNMLCVWSRLCGRLSAFALIVPVGLESLRLVVTHLGRAVS
jgi:hypothetical protein